ncbi:hypothetical protein [Paraburkholderia nodosa]|nr:hypothetical protein [Paraburkholderia nodosa]
MGTFNFIFRFARSDAHLFSFRDRNMEKVVRRDYFEPPATTTSGLRCDN